MFTLQRFTDSHSADIGVCSIPLLHGIFINIALTETAYDVFNRLVPVNETASGTTNYTYRPNGMRQAKIGSVITTHFWDGANIVADIEGGSVTAYIRGVNLIASVKGSTKNYFLYNAHGDVVLFGGKAYKYDAFGNELAPNASDANPFRYAGEYFDGETGTYYLRARYYDPSNGRFSSEDPIKNGLNWYTYCVGNPVMWIDPSGLVAIGIRDFISSYEGTTNWSDVSGMALFILNGRWFQSDASGNANVRFRVWNKDDRLYAEEADLLAFFFPDVYDNGVFESSHAAARDWGIENYAMSLYIRFEMASLIYSFSSNGTVYYSYTDSVVGSAHGVQPYDTQGDVPSNGTIVNALHTHPNSLEFSGLKNGDGDVNFAKSMEIGLYLIAPNLDLQLYADTGNGYTAITVYRKMIIKQLTQSQKTALQQQYENLWNAHVQEGCGFNCAGKTWPTE